jgi:GT2 family glycosyltransferase
MTLSVIIVNYNVKYFLDQCLLSVAKAMKGIEGEIIVVDNNSSDGSEAMLRRNHPDVTFIENSVNEGFSKANNQGIRIARGKYILLLNPDTIVGEDALRLSCSFMEDHPDCGALGLKMFDGGGNFLPESKRGFPSPWVAFCKIFGLNELFPSSRLFNTYYLGHLDKEQVQQIDVLTGAYMFIRKEALDKSGYLDETFFMYGEDIDLSYRIQQAGYKLNYLPDSSIIHFKGESTRKSSFNYVRNFYEAMLIFARKHFPGKIVRMYQFSIRSAIYLKAALSFSSTIIRRLFKPLIDMLILGFAFTVVKVLWAKWYFQDPDYFSNIFDLYNLPLYLFISLLSFVYLGKYHLKFSIRRDLRIFMLNATVLLIIYSILPANFRVSRALLIFGLVIGYMLIYVKDYLSKSMRSRRLESGRNVVIVGQEQHTKLLLELLDRRPDKPKLVGFISISSANSVGQTSNERKLGGIDSLESIVRFHNIQEIIFDQRSIDAQDIMKEMTALGDQYHFKIFTPDSGSLIGSNDRNKPGEVFTFDLEYHIASSYQRFLKRQADLLISGIFLVLSPFVLLFNKFQFKAISNLVDILFAKKTFVGYISNTENEHFLPAVNRSVFRHVNTDELELSNAQIKNLDFLYAREYSLWDDLMIIFSNFNKLGQS